MILLRRGDERPKESPRQRGELVRLVRLGRHGVRQSLRVPLDGDDKFSARSSRRGLERLDQRCVAVGGRGRERRRNQVGGEAVGCDALMVPAVDGDPDAGGPPFPLRIPASAEPAASVTGWTLLGPSSADAVACVEAVGRCWTKRSAERNVDELGRRGRSRRYWHAPGRGDLDLSDLQIVPGDVPVLASGAGASPKPDGIDVGAAGQQQPVEVGEPVHRRLSDVDPRGRLPRRQRARAVRALPSTTGSAPASRIA